MRLSQYIALITVIVVAWASLFTTFIILDGRQSQQITTEHSLLNKDTDIINGQTKTIRILSGKIDDLQNHDDCLFNLATRPNHGSDYIADTKQCAIVSVLTTPNSSKKVSAPSSSPVAASSSQSAPSSSKTQANSPPKSTPLICTLTLGLLGCTN